LPDAKKAAADSLTNIAACTTLQTSSSTERGMLTSVKGSPIKAIQAAEVSQKSSFNPKIEVQRAGAISPLIVMLRCHGDEGQMRAAANTLYVLAEEEENRSIMQDAGVRQVCFISAQDHCRHSEQNIFVEPSCSSWVFIGWLIDLSQTLFYSRSLVLQALQAVIALAKLRPPKVSAATTQDCEDTIARMIA
jgi:hypothetical protein